MPDNQVDDEPLQRNEGNIRSVDDTLETDLGKGDNDRKGDDKPGLAGDFEKPHKATTPSVEYDGIRDGDREAFDEIPGDDEEDDYPRTK
jgi:hypothetical protein